MIHHIIWHCSTAHTQRMHRRGVSAHTGAHGSARYIKHQRAAGAQAQAHEHTQACNARARERACRAYMQGHRRWRTVRMQRGGGDTSLYSGMNTNLLCASEVISPRPISMQFLVLFLCDPLEIGTVVVRANAVFMVYNIAVFVMRNKRPRNKQMNVNRPCFSVFCKSNLIISVYV